MKNKSILLVLILLLCSCLNFDQNNEKQENDNKNSKTKTVQELEDNSLNNEKYFNANKSIINDINKYSKKTYANEGYGDVSFVIYQKSGATINLSKADDHSYAVLNHIETPLKGQGFCSKYLPAFIKSDLVAPILQSSSAITIDVKTQESIAACKCYIKSFVAAGFKTLSFGFIDPILLPLNKKPRPSCGLPNDYKRSFITLEELDKFCQDDPFRNKSNEQKHVDCVLTLQK